MLFGVKLSALLHSRTSCWKQKTKETSLLSCNLQCKNIFGHSGTITYFLCKRGGPILIKSYSNGSGILVLSGFINPFVT